MMTRDDFDDDELRPDGPEVCGHDECENEPDGRCTACGGRKCGEHLLKISDERFCPTCAVCYKCGQPATMGCKECGEIVCEVHATGGELCAQCHKEAPKKVAA